MLLWNAISIYEKCFLKVIAVTCNGAFPNRKLFSRHSRLPEDDDINSETDATYRTQFT